MEVQEQNIIAYYPSKNAEVIRCRMVMLSLNTTPTESQETWTNAKTREGKLFQRRTKDTE